MITMNETNRVETLEEKLYGRAVIQQFIRQYFVEAAIDHYVIPRETFDRYNGVLTLTMNEKYWPASDTVVKKEWVYTFRPYGDSQMTLEVKYDGEVVQDATPCYFQGSTSYGLALLRDTNEVGLLRVPGPGIRIALNMGFLVSERYHVDVQAIVRERFIYTPTDADIEVILAFASMYQHTVQYSYPKKLFQLTERLALVNKLFEPFYFPWIGVGRNDWRGR